MNLPTLPSHSEDLQQMANSLDFEDTIMAIECARKILKNLRKHRRQEQSQKLFSVRSRNIEVVEEILNLHHKRLMTLGRKAS